MVNKLKRLGKWLACPPRPWGLVLGLGFLAFVGAVFLLGLEDTPIAYAAYLLSAYGLYLLVMATVVPLSKWLSAKVMALPVMQKLRGNAETQARVMLYRGAALNILYALFKLITGIYYGSGWFIAIAAYYFAVILIKLMLVRWDRRELRAEERSQAREWRVYRRAGALLMLMDLTLSGIFFQVIWRGKSWNYSGFIIFAMAAYAFYRIITAVIRVARGRKERRPLFSAAKAIDLTVAVVAMFSLQTAMLTSFGAGDAYFAALLNSITGLVSAAIVLGIATYMIVHSTRKLGETHE